jgi:cellulose synthase/poly-beta-1,6-N-acetylglucosamine synthase-like glycosyltransferase
MILDWITIIFFFLYALLLFYYRRGWQSLSEFIPPQNNKYSFISVVIAARNEENQIGKLLKALEGQTYPKDSFEIIVVDDFSTDTTAAVVKQSSLSKLSLIQPDVSKEASSKKKAIEAGIKPAKGELIVTTDADCIVPADWLCTINSFYTSTDASFIAAPVKFSHNQTTLQLFQALDFLVLQGITAASAGNHFHIMCNGANLAYKKQAFVDVKGFEGIDKVATGDDMLLMHKIRKQNPDKVFYLRNKNAIVTTQPMLTWKKFFMQRKRWASKTLVYDDYRIIAVLAFVYVFNFLFFILLIASFLNPVYWFYTLGYLLLKTAIEWPFVAAVAKFYNEQKLMRYFIFFQPLHIFYTVIVGALSQFGTYEWKERTTK